MTQDEQQVNDEGKPLRVPCPHCNGTGRMVWDPDIGTDQECFVCDGECEIPNPDLDE